jgi:hypothetical protein
MAQRVREASSQYVAAKCRDRTYWRATNGCLAPKRPSPLVEAMLRPAAPHDTITAPRSTDSFLLERRVDRGRYGTLYLPRIRLQRRELDLCWDALRRLFSPADTLPFDWFEAELTPAYLLVPLKAAPVCYKPLHGHPAMLEWHTIKDIMEMRRRVQPTAMLDTDNLATLGADDRAIIGSYLKTLGPQSLAQTARPAPGALPPHQ